MRFLLNQLPNPRPSKHFRELRAVTAVRTLPIGVYPRPSAPRRNEPTAYSVAIRVHLRFHSLKSQRR